jgi:hypothetical protein
MIWVVYLLIIIGVIFLGLFAYNKYIEYTWSLLEEVPPKPPIERTKVDVEAYNWVMQQILIERIKNRI